MPIVETNMQLHHRLESDLPSNNETSIASLECDQPSDILVDKELVEGTDQNHISSEENLAILLK